MCPNAVGRRCLVSQDKKKKTKKNINVIIIIIIIIIVIITIIIIIIIVAPECSRTLPGFPSIRLYYIISS